MKILKTRISSPIAYTLILFLIASVALVFYGQFSRVNYDTLNNTSSDVQLNSTNLDNTPTVETTNDSTVEENPSVSNPVSEPIPAADEAIPTTPLVEEVVPAAE